MRSHAVSRVGLHAISMALPCWTVPSAGPDVAGTAYETRYWTRAAGIVSGHASSVQATTFQAVRAPAGASAGAGTRPVLPTSIERSAGPSPPVSRRNTR